MLMDNFFQIVDERRSTKVYDPQVEIPREELVSLLEAAGKAPSAWNLQQWRFLVFDQKEVQERLLPIAYHQQQVHDASAVVAILGDLEANKNIDPVFDPAIEKGEMTAEIKEVLKKQIEGAYSREEYPRDAAYSNASLAAMQFMLAAKAKGWDTCPIGGFNPAALVSEFKVSGRYLPIMLITIGKPLQKARKTDRLDIRNLIDWAE
ncbi:nitroreductase family protein [Rossellomorea vietnamensis]|uniref:nitroreductase family protein n=1 Tax=Rossellomorea TaxID=2837508 RepID=UPI001CC8FBE5|nr:MULTISPECIES: nitroreductase family protein [Rossellomorea]MCA0149175.1 nitroreductase family protein [Rossellomorea vietnamensis]MCC5802857.1 nitroreductase family protein [Rossellomorea vietnamensis]UTE79373.1 nitroreductase family protein [Rossellomorea sp. KS-H15a]